MRSFFILMLITLGGVVTITLLQLNSFEFSHDVLFHRDFQKLQLSQTCQYELPLNSFDFLASHHGSAILSNRTNRRIVARFDNRGKRLTKGLLMFPEPAMRTFPSPVVSVDSSSIFFADGSVPCVFKTGADGITLKECAIRLPTFYDFTASGPGSAVIKMYDDELQQDRLAALNLQSGLLTQSDLLEKQLDGIFCVDGILMYESKAERIVYAYYYRNEVIVADRDLCLVNKVRTIDNVSTARITVDSWKEERGNVRTFSTPPLKINYKAAISDRFLFLVSNLKSEEETREEFEHSFPVDVYDITTGLYLGSLRIPSHISKQDVLNFDVMAELDTLWVIIDERITRFTVAGLIPPGA